MTKLQSRLFLHQRTGRARSRRLVAQGNENGRTSLIAAELARGVMEFAAAMKAEKPARAVGGGMVGAVNFAADDN